MSTDKVTDPAPADRVEITKIRDLANSQATSEALALCQARFAKDRNDVTALLGFGLIAGAEANFKSAHELLLAAHEIDPSDPLAVECLAILYALAGQIGDCAYYTKLAEANGSNHAIRALLPQAWPQYEMAYLAIREQAFFTDGIAAMAAGDLPLAIRLFENQISFNPNDGQTLRALADAYLAVDQPRKAGEILAPFLTNRTADRIDIAHAAIATAMTGENGLANHLLETAVNTAGDGTDYEIAAAKITCASYDPAGTAATLRATVKAALPEGSAPVIVGAAGKLGTPLRIGLLASAALSEQDMSTAGALVRGAYSTPGTEIIVFGSGAQHLKCNRPFQGQLTNWVDVMNFDPETLAYTINGEGVDVVIDIGGASAPTHLAAIGLHPAPKCLSWFGMAAAMPYESGGYDDGLSAPLLDPDGGGILLPDGLIGVFGATRAQPKEHDDTIMLGSDFNMGQMTPDFAAVVGSILHALPGAHFFVRNRELNHPSNLDRLASLIEPYNVAERIHIVDADLPSLLADIDLFLSPFIGQDGYAALTAIAMGKPAIALAGDGRLRRYSASALHCAGVSQWIAGAPDDYVGLALDIAMNRASIDDAAKAASSAAVTAVCFDQTAFGTGMARTLLRELNS